MTQQTYRTIGALLGLALGMGLTVAFGYGGSIVPSALIAAGGCVTGAVLAERLHDRKGE